MTQFNANLRSTRSRTVLIERQTETGEWEGPFAFTAEAGESAVDFAARRTAETGRTYRAA